MTSIEAANHQAILGGGQLVAPSQASPKLSKRDRKRIKQAKRMEKEEKRISAINDLCAMFETTYGVHLKTDDGSPGNFQDGRLYAIQAGWKPKKLRQKLSEMVLSFGLRPITAI
jgi:hypothetical protein